MKIALAIDFFYPELGGMQDSVALLAQELGRRGHTVEIYVPNASAKNYKVVGLPVGELGVPLVGTNHFAVTEYAMYYPFIEPERFKRWSTKAVTWYYNHCAYVSGPLESVVHQRRASGLHAESEVGS